MARYEEAIPQSNLCGKAIMIFVTVGTAYKFESLIKYMDELSLRLDEKIIIQTGRSEYVPIYCNYFTFAKDLSNYIEEASLVISHGGAGTCYEILKLGKKLIGVENKNVHDSHQWDLLNKLEEEGYIIWCREINNLEHDIQRALNHDFKRYISPPCEIPKIIDNFLNGKT